VNQWIIHSFKTLSTHTFSFVVWWIFCLCCCFLTSVPAPKMWKGVFHCHILQAPRRRGEFNRRPWTLRHVDLTHMAPIDFYFVDWHYSARKFDCRRVWIPFFLIFFGLANFLKFYERVLTYKIILKFYRMMCNEIWRSKGNENKLPWCCLTVNGNVIYHLLQISESLYFFSVGCLFALYDSLNIAIISLLSVNGLV
jgi:hypothetical protein